MLYAYTHRLGLLFSTQPVWTYVDACVYVYVCVHVQTNSIELLNTNMQMHKCMSPAPLQHTQHIQMIIATSVHTHTHTRAHKPVQVHPYKLMPALLQNMLPFTDWHQQEHTRIRICTHASTKDETCSSPEHAPMSMLTSARMSISDRLSEPDWPCLQ